MNGLQAYRFYMAVKTHFTTKSYDVFVNKGRFSNISEETFLKKPQAKFFQSLAKKFKEPRDYIQFLVASSAYGKTEDIFDPIVSFNYYQEWRKNKQKSTQLILDDISNTPNILSSLIGDPPVILKYVITNKIHIETASAIDIINPYLKDHYFDKKYLILAETAIKIKKLEKFIKFDKEIVLKHLENV